MSLREMFVLVAATALAIVSLVTASFVWQSILCLVVVLSAMIALVVSLVDRGPRRAFAIGFAVAMLGYLVVVANVHHVMPADQFGNIHTDNVEFSAYNGVLPTSIALRHLYGGISRTTYFDAKTNQQIPNSESGNLFVVGRSSFGVGGGAFGGLPINAPPGQRAAWSNVEPPGASFMVVGHFWWALLFGYVGGHFARFVYFRREREANSSGPS